jgi:hypothetical protein
MSYTKIPLPQGTLPSDEDLLGQCLDWFKSLEMYQHCTVLNLPDRLEKDAKEILISLTNRCEDV